MSPVAVEAMQDDGIDIGSKLPKRLTEAEVRQADVIVTLGCQDACPTYSGKRYEDWKLPAVGGRDLDAVRRTRDEIKRRVQVLAADLLA